MKVIYSAALLCLALIATSSCANRTSARNLSIETKTKEINVGSFNSIDVSIVDLIFTQGEASGIVKIVAPENIIDYVTAEVKDNELEIKVKKDSSWDDSMNGLTIKAYVTAPYIKEIDGSASSGISFTNGLQVEGDLEIDLSTAASLSLNKLIVKGSVEIEATTAAGVSIEDIVCNNLKVEASTAGSVSLASTSTVAKATYEASTAGSISAGAVKATTGSAQASTGGSIKCNILNNPQLESTTGGSINNR